MRETPAEQDKRGSGSGKVGWGPRLFVAVLVALLAFFYWLLIYSGGVAVHHG